MTDSPTPRRHRGSRRAPKRSRGLVGPIASALSVLLAVGPVVWLMSRESSTIDDATKVLNVSEDTRADGSTADSTGSTPGTPLGKSLPSSLATTGARTTILGSAASTSTPGAATSIDTPSGTPSSVVTTPQSRSVTTVTVKPSRTTTTRRTTPRTASRKTATTEPKPSESSQPLADGGGDGTSAQEREVLEYTNAIRENQGCGPLQLDSALVEAAGRHASDMARRHYLDHTNPEGQGPGDRMAAAGYSGSGWGENIAAGYETAKEVVAAWMKSEGHRENILNCRFTSIGIGYDPGQVRSDYGPGSWVQDFGRS